MIRDDEVFDGIFEMFPEAEVDIEKLEKTYKNINALLDLWLAGDDSVGDKVWDLLEEVRQTVGMFRSENAQMPTEMRAVRIF